MASLLHINNISVAVHEKEVVHTVSASFEKGSISVLMGPNGSGKSTLANALMGHPDFTLTNGTVLFNGRDITHATVTERAHMGLFLSLQYIPKVEGVNLATFLHKVHTARTNDDVSILDYYISLREMAQSYGINEALLDKPLTAERSGGEKKLSEVLQLSALMPKVAILDEIDSGVDIDAMKKVFKVVRALKEQGVTFVIISHHPTLLEHIDPEQVLVMSAGTIAKRGGSDLARDVLTHGFCKTAQCAKEGACSGRCS